jgi:hypothetical protein
VKYPRSLEEAKQRTLEEAEQRATQNSAPAVGTEVVTALLPTVRLFITSLMTLGGSIVGPLRMPRRPPSTQDTKSGATPSFVHEWA